MDRQTSPPGRTFEERWPDDARHAEYLAQPWQTYLFGLGAAFLAVPILMARLAANAPWVIAILIAAALGLSVLIPRLRGRVRGRAISIWVVLSWLLLAVPLGVLVAWVAGAACDAGCDDAVGNRIRAGWVGPAAVVTAANIVGGLLVTAIVDGARRWLRRRPAPGGLAGR